MEYVAHHNPSPRPGAWAAEREAEGVWHGLSTSDHVTEGAGAGPVAWRHAFITLTEMACATSQVHLNAAFANNLVRSPVEFAQMSLALHDLSGGRYEAALGAGWAREELEAMGIEYPDSRARARRFKEALIISRDLLSTGNCTFSGEHYTVDVVNLGPLTMPTPPLLIGAAAGPWVLRNIAPVVDMVELAFPGPANPMKSGKLDFSQVGQIGLDTIAESCARVREGNPDVAISCAVPFAVGRKDDVAPMKAMMGDGFYGSCIGEPAEVAANLRQLEPLGITRITLMPIVDGSHRLIAPHLAAAD